MEIKGWVRSRRRGNFKLLFLSVDPEPLIEEYSDEEDLHHDAENPVNDQHSHYYKYKTSFGTTDTSLTLIITSDDGNIRISDEQTLTCDQLRKYLSVGSEIHCLATREERSNYTPDTLPPWFRSEPTKYVINTLMKVQKIISISSSRTVVQRHTNLPDTNCGFTSSSLHDPAPTQDNQEEQSQIIPTQEIHPPVDQKHKSERAEIFVDWLIGTFTVEYLNSGSGVLDIAGGRGAISWELQCKRGIKSTLVDPRTVHLSGRQKKYLRKTHGSPFAHQQIALTNPEQDKETLTKMKFDVILQKCSLIVGMHPDEATESIVEYANYYHKPFAIVPCCVYAEVFPYRRIGNLPVLTYEHLLEYLQFYKSNCLATQDGIVSGVHRTTLAIQGRNILLYRTLLNKPCE
jgi:hypothetical protein